jgi:hypothetical protein
MHSSLISRIGVFGKIGFKTAGTESPSPVKHEIFASGHAGEPDEKALGRIVARQKTHQTMRRT